MRKLSKDPVYAKIDRTALDALLDALVKKLDFFGDQRRAIFEKMDSAMRGYLIETGTISASGGPKALGQSLRRLLAKNGYSPVSLGRTMEAQGSDTAPSLLEILAPGGRASGGKLSRRRASTTSRERVDWVLYEAVLYAITKALDEQLGIQGQLILDRIGTSMLDYLIEVGAIERSDDADTLLQRVIDYFIEAGYAKSFRFELEGAPPHTFVSRYKSARYYTNVFRRTQKEGSALLACPLCLIGHSMWATRGWRFGDIFEVRISSDGAVFTKAKVYPSTERFTEKDALRFSRMKVQLTV